MAALVTGSVWWWASSPSIAGGSSGGASAGILELSDPISTTKWAQDADVALIQFSVKNNGRLDATLSAGPRPFEDETVVPRQRVGFSPQESPFVYAPATTDWSQLASSITVPAGEEAWVVARVLYPTKCQVPLDTAEGFNIIQSLQLQQTTLLRTTTIDVALPYPLYIPVVTDGSCSAEDFVPVETSYPAR